KRSGACVCGRYGRRPGGGRAGSPALDLVRHGAARDREPATAAVNVKPALLEPALGIAAHVEIVGPFGVGERIRVLRSEDPGLAAVAELDLVARAAEGAGDEQHQCATAAAPCSSTRAPLEKRSSGKGAASG